MTAATPLQLAKEVIVVATIWLVAVAGPAMVADRDHRPGVVFWIVLAAGYAVLAYDAVDGWGRGRRLPLVLRIVVPAVLLAASVAALQAGLWDGLLAHLRTTS